MKKPCTDHQNKISIFETQESSFRTNDFVEEPSSINHVDIDPQSSVENTSQQLSNCESILNSQNQSSCKPLKQDEQVVILIVNNDDVTSHSIKRHSKKIYDLSSEFLNEDLTHNTTVENTNLSFKKIRKIYNDVSNIISNEKTGEKRQQKNFDSGPRCFLVPSSSVAADKCDQLSELPLNNQNHIVDTKDDIDMSNFHDLDSANENTPLEDDSYILVVKEEQNDESYFNSEELEPYFQQSLQESNERSIDVVYYVCNTCGKRYTNKNSLQTHYYSVCPQKRKKRGIRLRKIDSLTGNSGEGDGKQLFTCKKCGQTFQTKQEYRRHVRCRCKVARDSRGPYVCERCGKVFKHSSTLSNHIRMHRNERNHPCKQCEKRFNTPARLGRHIRIVHMGLKDFYMCIHCGLKSKSKAHIEAHEKLHFLSEGETPERPFSCDKCGKRFISKHELTVHIYDYHRSKKCPHCPEMYTSKYLFNRHKLEKHPTKYGKKRTWPDGRMKKTITVAESKPLLPCPICDVTYKVFLNLKKHLYQLHGLDDPKEVKRAKCLDCNKSYTSLAYYVFHKLQAHKRTVTEEEIEAYQAYQATPEEVVAAAAKRRERGSTREVKTDTECNVCHKVYETRAQMMNHRWAMHNDDPCYCEPCDRTFPNRSRLAVHKWEVHVKRDESELTCHICGKVFQRIKSLLGHRVVHDGIVHDCPKCESRFKRKADLTRHIRDKHGVPGPYVASRKKAEVEDGPYEEDVKGIDVLEYHEDDREYEEDVKGIDVLEHHEDDREFEEDVKVEGHITYDDAEYLSDAN